jgi:hypothetical protein
MYIIFFTFDFIIFGWFCLHHVFELIGSLLIGFWLANSVRAISPINVVIVYIFLCVLGSIFLSGTVTFRGVVASVIVLSPLLIGYWLKKWWNTRKSP